MGILTDPRTLSASLGREGWCQRLLTELILDGPYPPYNSRIRPSSRGVTFLGALDEVSFGRDSVSATDVVFVDEIDLPARHDDEKGCAPDYTVFTAGRCWMIELKTEPGSHRPRQIPDYFERAHHYHSELQVDVTYLTAGLRRPFQPRTEPWERYAHVEWKRIDNVIRDTWSVVSDSRVREVAAVLVNGITHLDLPLRDWWAVLGYGREPVSIEPGADEHVRGPSAQVDGVATDVVSAEIREGLALAAATSEDGQQRALGVEAGGLEALHEIRLGLRRAIRAEQAESGLQRVQPWLWSAATSGGKAMTTAGRRTGYEVRFSHARLST